MTSAPMMRTSGNERTTRGEGREAAFPHAMEILA